MRVLMIAPTPFFSDRGCHVRIFEQAVFLEKSGVEVKIITYPLGCDPPGLKVHRVSRVVPYNRSEAGPAWARLLLDSAMAPAAGRLCRAFRPHLLHAHLHEGCMVGALLKKLFRLPLVFDYQGSLVEESLQHGFISRGGVLEGAFSAAERGIDRSPDVILTSAAVLADSIKGNGPPVETLPDWVDTDRFRPACPDAALKEKLGVQARVPLVVYLGVTSHYQGTDLLLHAARSLQDRGKDFHFLVMGYPEQEYVDAAKRMGLAQRMTFTGRVNYFQSHSYLQLGDAAVAPKLSSTESNGKLLNYMACGLPIAAFDLPVNREIAGDCAEWVEPSEDREKAGAGIAEALARLINDRDRSRELGARARERVIGLYSPEKQAPRLLDVYRRLTGIQ